MNDRLIGWSLVILVWVLGVLTLSIARSTDRIADSLEEAPCPCTIEYLSESERVEFKKLLLDELEGLR